MADVNFALNKAVEITKAAVESPSSNKTAYAHPDEVAKFLETIHDKLIELTNKDGY